MEDQDSENARIKASINNEEELSSLVSLTVLVIISDDTDSQQDKTMFTVHRRFLVDTV